MAKGQLSFELYDSTVAMPIANGSIIVRDTLGNEVYSGFTDESGQSEIIELDTVSVDYSLSPDEPQPYTLYNAEITADGYKNVLINGIQVFPDSTAIQRIYMQQGTGEVVINVPPPVLYGKYQPKEPEEEVKPEPEDSGFVVLDEVVIPEYIVVHTGLPSANAENYYIPYKDYIKNVASSEIYSTWSDEAIRANVLAIQSFVLNRVYTEWYRNKGYNFTITNSTRYDQSFSYGRTIYENISQIVDELFVYYLKREGAKQPLFAQYCDGKSVTCPEWLSQWGSEELAQQGYTAMEIIRYYYGDDVYVAEAERVSGVPISYPGEELTIGSRGNDVRTIQNQLNSISNSYPAIPKIRNDGIYGPNTAEAVEIFQGIFNMPQTGVVDLATWYQISQIYVAIEQLAAL